VVELLVKEGADVSVSDRWGNKPLDDARCATKNSKEIMKLLKANGAVSPSLFLPFASRAKKKGPGKTIPTISSIGTIVYWPPEMFVDANTPKPSMDMWSAGGMFNLFRVESLHPTFSLPLAIHFIFSNYVYSFDRLSSL
jgi:serine/threonine protein kinase